MNRRDRHPSSIALYLISAAFSFALWVFYFANVVYASDCPPNDPSRIDCANAAQTANNPATPASGTVAGTGTSIAIDRLRNRRRGRFTPKPPTDYGPGRTNVWDPPVDEQTRKWVDEGLVWDPQTLSWRPPKAGEILPPPDAPEKPPPYEQQHPRDKVPPDCLDLYDQYVKAQARTIEVEQEIQDLSKAQWDAQFNLNQLLAKFTLKFGYDLPDTVLLAKGVAELTVHLGDAMLRFLPRTMAEALESARSVFRNASTKVTSLTSELSEAGQIAASKTKVADEAAAAAKALSGESENAGKALTEGEELLGNSKKAVEAAEEEVASVGSKLDGLRSSRDALLAEKDALNDSPELQSYDKWKQAYYSYLGQKPAVGIGAKLYEEQFKLDMIGLDIATTKIDVSKLRALPNPTPAQIQELAALESKVGNLYNEAAPLKATLDQAAKQFYGVDDVSKITHDFMDQHLQDHLRNVMGDDAFAQYNATSAEAMVQKASRMGEIEKELDGLGKQITSAAQESQKAGTKAVNLKGDVQKAQTAIQKLSSDASEAASKASEAESKATDATQEATQAGEQVTKEQSSLNEAQQEQTAAQASLKTIESAAHEEMKRHFAETPDEVAKVLIAAKNSAQRAADDLKLKQFEYDGMIDVLKEIKPKLDSCVDEHTPYGASSVSNN